MSKFEHSSFDLPSPVVSQIRFKILILAEKPFHSLELHYFFGAALPNVICPTPNPRSSKAMLHHVDTLKEAQKSFARSRASFSVAPILWN